MWTTGAASSGYRARVSVVTSSPSSLVHAPQAQPDDLVVADVELALDGLLSHGDPLGAAVPLPGAVTAPSPFPRVAVSLTPELAASALEAGAVFIADTESTPVAVLREVRLRAGDASTVEGRLHPVREGETGPARELRVARNGPGEPSSAPATFRGCHVVVLGRPLLADDEQALRRPAEESDGDVPIVLAVPVGSPSPDGVPALTLLRIARERAAALGARVLAVPIAWRDAASNEALVAHVGAGMEAAETTYLRPRHGGSQPASRGDRSWRTTLQALQDGRSALPHDAPAPTLRELQRWRPPRHRRGLVVFFTGLSGSGKSTLARALCSRISESGERSITLLDGDVVRRLLSSGLGFDAAGRDLNVRRIGYVAGEIARHGGIAVCAPIAPYAHSRAVVRAMVEEVGDLVLVHVSTPLDECERRDLKGLYARARAGQITGFTGINDPYEEPEDADLRIDTSVTCRDDAVDAVLRHLRDGGWLGQPSSATQSLVDK